ncbi:helix-turn-helix domain-containing protein [Rhodococcus hoagii]|nr:helix-turn-helix domain-containing protein [Prescottella equi]MBM4654094.1 helix-turn-helix domain-containing protein [Prescottella equi]MBM4719568.1 helix-turn-helix domain-containing protein [Prescottella equi]NKR23367.1 helix-turn-helix domain-containing protein [Prescottella equi]NKT56022.1 helix-turn-helix domain-containing protein [Prescottella equi]
MSSSPSPTPGTGAWSATASARFAAHLWRLRIDRGLSPDQLAERSGIGRNEILSMERNVVDDDQSAPPSLSAVHALARALEVAPYVLLPQPVESDTSTATVRLWVDDLRPAPPGWTAVTNGVEAIAILATGQVAELSLDHDLGGEDTTRPVVMWMCEYDAWPSRVQVHSANPVGVQWLTGMLNRYGPPSL